MIKEKMLDRSSLGAPRQNGPYKNQHMEQHITRWMTGRNRLSKYFYVFLFFIFQF